MAIEDRARPTAYILHVQPFSDWDDNDFRVREAWSILQAERCGQCGLPKYVCHNDSPDLEFDIIEDDCRAIAAKTEREESEREAGGDTYKPSTSTTLRPHQILTSGADPATLREPYYRAQYEMQKQLERDVEASKAA